jgi:hypothetical protein
MTTQDGSVTPRLVAAIDGAWSAIRARHPDVPEVVITLGAGSGGRRGLTYGHFHDGIWQHGDARLPELFIGGEGLQRGPVPVLGTLLHESAHGIAARRGIRDTSRQSRYHNERFRALAAEVGIDVEKDPAIGPTRIIQRKNNVWHHGQVTADQAGTDQHNQPAADDWGGNAWSCSLSRRRRWRPSPWT